MSLKSAILATLSRRPRSGYEIAKSIEGGIGFFWNATHQQIYKELSKLEKTGLLSHKEVEQTNAPTKKVYKLSTVGKKELKMWIEAETEPSIIRDPFLIKIFVGHLISPSHLLKMIERHKAKRQKTLETYLQIEKMYFSNLSQLSVEQKFQRLVVRRGISHSKNWLEWVKEVESFVEALNDNLLPK